MDNSTFKSSVFGGFDRSDVISYIERTAQENAKRIKELEDEADKLMHESLSLREQLSAAEEERSSLSEALSAESERRTAAEQALEALRAEADELRAQVAALSQERDRLSSDSAALRAQVEEYDTVKSHIADIELSARARADALEAETRERMGRVLQSCRERFEEAVAHLSRACLCVTDELHSTEDRLSLLPETLEGLRSEMDALISGKHEEE